MGTSGLKKKEKAFAISKFFLDVGAGMGDGGPAGVVGNNLRESVSSAAAANAAELQRKREEKRQKKGLVKSLIGGGAGYLVGGAPGMALGAGLAGAKSAGDVTSAIGNFTQSGGFQKGPLTGALFPTKGLASPGAAAPAAVPGSTGDTPGIDTSLFNSKLSLGNQSLPATQESLGSFGSFGNQNPPATQGSLGSSFYPYYDDQLKIKNKYRGY